MKRIEKSERWRLRVTPVRFALYILVLAIATHLPSPANAQEHVIQTINVEESLQQDVESSYRLPNGDLLVVGWIWRPRSGKDALIARLTPTGQPVWQKIIATSQEDRLVDIAALADHSFVAVGTTYACGIGSADILVVKFLENGHIQWRRVIGGVLGEFGMSVTGTPDGRIAIAGLTESWGAGWQDIFLVQMWLNGDVFFARTYGSAMPEEVYDITPAVEGNGYVIVGATMATRGGIDGIILRVDYNGQVLWQRRFGGNGIDRFYRIIAAYDVTPGYVIAGYSAVFGQRYADFLLLRITTDGSTILWARRFGKSGWDYAQDIRATPDFGFIVVGRAQGSGTGDDALVVKTDWQGNPVAALRFSSVFNDRFNSVEVEPNGTFLALGQSPATGSADAIIVARWNFQNPNPDDFCAFRIESDVLEVSEAPDNGYTWDMTAEAVSNFQVQTGHFTETNAMFELSPACLADGGRPAPKPQPIDILPIPNTNP